MTRPGQGNIWRIQPQVAHAPSWPATRAGLLYTAAYDSVRTRWPTWTRFEQLHMDQVIGKYDAAVIDKREANGRAAE